MKKTLKKVKTKKGKKQKQGITVLPIVIMLASVIAFGAMGYSVYRQMYPAKTAVNTNGVSCTLEAMLCPDGVTYVGRSGPNCEFASCPTDDITTADLEHLYGQPISAGSSVWSQWRYTNSRVVEGKGIVRIYQPDHLLASFTSDTYETHFFRDDGYLNTHDSAHGGARGDWTGAWRFDDTTNRLYLDYDDGSQLAYEVVTLQQNILELFPVEVESAINTSTAANATKE